MALTPIDAATCLAQLDRYDAIIDARSEGEFALDLLAALAQPGNVSGHCP